MTEIKAEIDFVQLAKDVACIKQAVLGNGQAGLCKRVELLENQDKIQSKFIGICTGIGVAIGGAITYFINIFKG